MQVLEFSRGMFRKRYVLALVLTPESPDALLQQLREVKLALLQWADRRGHKAGQVMFTVVTASQYFDECESIFRRLVEDERELAPVLKRLKVQLEFPGRRGKNSERSVTLNAP